MRLLLKFICKPLLLEAKGKNINWDYKWNFEVQRTSALNSEPLSLLLMTGALGGRTRHVLDLRYKNEVPRKTVYGSSPPC